LGPFQIDASNPYAVVVNTQLYFAIIAVTGYLLSSYVERSVRLNRRLRESQRNAQQRAEEAAQANATKTNFLANMSHELRTPLNSIIGFSELMVQRLYGPLGDDRYDEYVANIHYSGGHLLTVISDILDMAKVESEEIQIEKTNFAISELISDCSRLVGESATRAGVELIVEANGTLPFLLVDERRIRQILLNLLSNSIKFTPQGGEVRVGALLNDHGGIRMIVVDTGFGIAEEDIERVFQPFVQSDSHFTNAEDGTGLGLALVRSLTELHGGTVDLQSEVGKGTIIHIDIPIERNAEHSDEVT
jgi:two-component system cell cycle sensor histidine kinase PleC